MSRPTVQLWRERFLALRLPGLEKDATRWSTRTMANARGLSEATVRRIWHQHRLKPRLVEGFKLGCDKRFIEKLHDVAGLHLNPPDKALVLCVGEKSRFKRWTARSPCRHCDRAFRRGRPTTANATAPPRCLPP